MSVTLAVSWPRPEVLAPLAAVLFNLFALRDQLLALPAVNDSSVHMAVARWTRRLVDSGQSPIDAWFPHLQLGLALSRHYQALPDLLTGLLGWPFGVDVTYRWLLYLLLATWPLSVYVGVRLLGWDPRTAAAAALISPLLHSVTGYGFEHESYIWQGNGLYPQLWAMWLFPIGLGLAWQAVNDGRRVWLAALVVGGVVICHFLTGYLALAAVLVWALVDPFQLPARLARAALVLLGAAAAAGWVLLPVAIDGAYSASSIFIRGTFWLDSYGAATVIGWLAGGRLLDEGRLAIITILTGIGIVLTGRMARADLRARAVLGFLALSLVLYSGRPTFGPLIDLLPGNADIYFTRFISAVHMAAIILAGVALAWLVGHLERALAGLKTLPSRAVPALALAAGLVALAPSAQATAADDFRMRQLAAIQRIADEGSGRDFDALVATAAGLGGGRIYAGAAGDFGANSRIGYIAPGNVLINNGVSGVGLELRVPALTEDAEAQFNSSDAAQYDLFNIRYLIAPSGQSPPAGASLLASRGAYRLWRIPTSGYLDVVDSAGPPVIANRFTLGSADAAMLKQRDYASGVYHQVAFAGSGTAAATLTSALAPGKRPGQVVVEADDPDRGIFIGQVHFDRPGLVILKSTFDPNWRITVDGVRVQPSMVAPGYPAIEVPSGAHQVAFRYQGWDAWPWLIGLGTLALAGLWLLEPRLLRLAPAASRAEPEPPVQPVPQPTARPRRLRSRRPRLPEDRPA